MYSISKKEAEIWEDLFSMSCEKNTFPSFVGTKINLNLLHAFYFFIGLMHISKGNVQNAEKWVTKGSKYEFMPINSTLLNAIKNKESFSQLSAFASLRDIFRLIGDRSKVQRSGLRT